MNYTPDQVVNRGDKNGYGIGLQVEIQPWKSRNHQLTVGFRNIRTGGSFSSLDSCYYTASGSSNPDQWIIERFSTEIKVDRIEFPINYLIRSSSEGRVCFYGQIGAALSVMNLKWEGKRFNNTSWCHGLNNSGTLSSTQNVDWTLIMGAGAEFMLSEELDLVTGVYLNSCSKMTFNEEFFSDNNDLSVRQQFLEFMLGLHC